MTSPFSRLHERCADGAKFAQVIRRFGRARHGQVAMLFGLASTGILLATGSGIDLSRAYQARQKLSEVATLGCQYASRPAILQTAGSGTTYSTAVNGFITASLTSQDFVWTQTTATPFTYTPNGPAGVTLTANVPTAFMQLAGVTQLTVSAASHCYDNPSSVSNSPYLLREGFEVATCSGSCYEFNAIPGRSITSPSTSFTQSPLYTGANGAVWYGTGHCLETDSAGIINASVPEGSRSAELDCDNGSGSAGNSAISSKVYMGIGNYELRYYYRSRVSYPNYDPAYVCSSAASDLSWANDTNSSGGPVANALRTNQLNVYLDRNSTGSPPTHTTIDGTQSLAGSNLVDMCVYSTNWVERSVRIYVTTAGDHWLTFAADGQNDSYGPQVDDIRLCPGTCPGTVDDNFPTAWLPSSGVNKVLFRDTLESPSYSGTGCSGTCNTAGNMNNSTGTSGTASSGWTSAAAAGWATAPYNQVDYKISGAAEGSRYIELDATKSGSQITSNRLISRAFLLDPGYYNVSYYYKSQITASWVPGTYCGSTPAAAGLTAVPAGYDTNYVGSFMAHSDMASYPIGGGALNSTTSYKNPNGTTTTTPTVAPNSLSYANYNAAQANPLLDLCGYSQNWVQRSRNILITKPAYYYLTISALGEDDDQAGGSIDDIKVTALGSPYMTAPTNVQTIPVPNPQPSAQVTYSSFYIIANPLQPTAPAQ